jgi:hypothetical protein
MKIEIEIPLDQNEWEYLGHRKVSKGEWYWDGTLSQWGANNPHVHEQTSGKYYVFRKKQNWKDKIVWPSVFREGCWVCRTDDNGLYLNPSKPEYGSRGGWKSGSVYSYIHHNCMNLSFLPQEFWDCKPEDSLVQVTHEVKG